MKLNLEDLKATIEPTRAKTMSDGYPSIVVRDADSVLEELLAKYHVTPKEPA